jgi:hypothetical protein
MAGEGNRQRGRDSGRAHKATVRETAGTAPRPYEARGSGRGNAKENREVHCLDFCKHIKYKIGVVGPVSLHRPHIHYTFMTIVMIIIVLALIVACAK